MAKKEETEPEYDFIPPDFDEEQFIHKEMVSFRTTVVLFAWGIVAALVAWLLYGPVGGARTGWYLGIAVAAALGVALKWVIPATKTDISHWGRREWTGTAFLYFFTWLSFFILFLNPPLGDHSPPRVDLYASPAVQTEGGAVVLHAFFSDNARLADAAASVDGPGGPLPIQWEDLGDGHLRARLEGLAAGAYTLAGQAEDRAGHDDAGELVFEVEPNVLQVDAEPLDSDNDELYVEVPEGITANAVHLDLEGGGRVELKPKKGTDGGWVATRNHAGWRDGTNNFTVVVEQRNRFHLDRLVEGGTIVDPRTYSVLVQVGDDVQDIEPRTNPTRPPPRPVPGFEVPLLLVGLVVMGVVLRRR